MRLPLLPLLLATCLAFLPPPAPAQAGPAIAPPANRLAAQPNLTPTARLAGHVPSWASPDRDRGKVPGTTPLHLTFVLTRSAERQAAFTQLLADQQDPSSPSFHQWLTPQQVGELYGPTQADLDTFTSWLSAQGLTVTETAPSRVFLHVSASAFTGARAFATDFHFFDLDGTERLAATSDPQLPAALLPLVGAIAGLADIPIQPTFGSGSAAAAPTGPHPEFTSASSGAHYVTPADFALIFDLQQTQLSGITGAGQKIAIIGRSRVVSTDISEYQTNTNLAANLPNTIIPPAGVDPGITGNGDQSEATLDVDRVLGTAPNASVDLVVSGTAGGLNGIYLAAQYEVQTLRDPVMNLSFGSCEVLAGPSGVSLWDTLFAQAASEGISVFVSASDSGAATCDTQFATPPAYQFRSINYICASSYATCVGGTEFADTNPNQYWSTGNTTGLASALSYIPEGAWNEFTSGTTYVAASGGGGASLYIPKPAWQAGTGVPADNARDVPDVSFPASAHDGYYACYAAGNGDCAANRYEYFYGTSAAAPAMAAVTALLNQKSGHSQGNLNPLLYRLAASTPSAFHDATPTSSGIGLSCTTLAPSLCNNSTPSPNAPIGGLAGFDLTTGYDQATGLGSLDITNFLNAAAALTASSLAHTSLAVTELASTIADTQTNTFTATLTTPSPGTPATGSVQFFANGAALGSPVPITAGTAIAATQPFPAAGSYLITATYSGDIAFASATAPGIALTVTGFASQSRLTLTSSSIPVGTSTNLSVTVSPTSGTAVPTGLVRFYSSALGYLATVPLVNGAATIPNTFSTVGTSTLTAYYLGDTVFSPSTSPSLLFTVQKLQSTLTVTATAASVGTGGSELFNVSLLSATPASSAPGATGTIQLLANGVPLGATILLTGNNAATISAPLLFSTPGAQTITASYSGDANWAANTGGSAAITVLPTPAAYQIATPTPTLTITAGASTANTATVSAVSSNGFVGVVTLACAITYNGTGIATAPPACLLSTNLLSLGYGSYPVFSTLTFTSTAAHTLHTNPVSRLTPTRQATLAAALLLTLLPLRRRTRLRTSLFSALILTALFASLTGCGGGSGGSASTPTPTPVPGTSPGSYTVTITASTANPATPVPAPVTIGLTIQ